jgi:hypothetical protein
MERIETTALRGGERLALELRFFSAYANGIRIILDDATAGLADFPTGCMLGLAVES